MIVLHTDRLCLRRFSLDDEAQAAFIVELLNQPGYLRFIGDKGVRDLDGARRYLETGPIASYEKNGFGLWLVERKAEGDPIGICGLIRRDTLPDVDLGYALHSAFEGHGYALEAARAAIDYGRSGVGLRRIVAITDVDNERSMRLLAKLGFVLEGKIRMTPEGAELNLFAIGAA